MTRCGTYRTQSGRFCFRWLFQEQPNGEVRAYILQAPAYESAFPANRRPVNDSASGNWTYIQVEPMPQSFHEAVRLAKAWAERTEAYIDKSGEF